MNLNAIVQAFSTYRKVDHKKVSDSGIMKKVLSEEWHDWILASYRVSCSCLGKEYYGWAQNTTTLRL